MLVKKVVAGLQTAKTLRVVCVLALVALLIGSSACQVLGKHDGPTAEPPSEPTAGSTAGSTGGPAGGSTTGSSAGATSGSSTAPTSGSTGESAGESTGGSASGPTSGPTPGSTGGTASGPDSGSTGESSAGSSAGSPTGPDAHSSADSMAVLEKLYDSKTFYTDYVRHLEALVNEYSDTGIVRMTSIGKSVEGRDIHAVILGTEGGATRITINATHHSDEYINTILVLNQIEHILRLYRDGGEFDGVSVRQLLAKSEIYFIPLVNPEDWRFSSGILRPESSKRGSPWPTFLSA